MPVAKSTKLFSGEKEKNSLLIRELGSSRVQFQAGNQAKISGANFREKVVHKTYLSISHLFIRDQTCWISLTLLF